MAVGQNVSFHGQLLRMSSTKLVVRGLVLSLACGFALPTLLHGQVSSPEGPSFEAVEVFRPATGERQHRLVAPLSAEERRAVERALREAGEAPGPIDGQVTPATEEALRAYQKRRGLTPCGCVNWETVRRLGLPTTVTITEVAAGDGPAQDPASGVEVVYPSTPGPERQSGRAAADSVPSAPDTVVIFPRSRSRFDRGHRYGGIPVFVRPDGAVGSTPPRTPSPSSSSSLVPPTGVPRLLPFVRPVIPREGGRP